MVTGKDVGWSAFGSFWHLGNSFVLTWALFLSGSSYGAHQALLLRTRAELGVEVWALFSCVSERPQWQGAGVLPQAGLRAPEPGGVEGLVCPALPPCPRLQPHLCHVFLTPVGRYIHRVPAQLPERLISVHAYPFLQLRVKSPWPWCYADSQQRCQEYRIAEPSAFRWLLRANP